MVIPEVVVRPTFLSVRSCSVGASSIVRSTKFPINRVYCIGRNYREHAAEMGHDPEKDPPFFFCKPANAVRDCSGDTDGLTPHPMVRIPYPPMTRDLHHEAEVVVAIGASAFRLASEEQAKRVICGYGLGCDLTRRDLQAEAKKLSRPWDLAKGFDHSAPCGRLVPSDEFDLTSQSNQDLELQLTVNGEVRQKGRLRQMIWSIPETILYLSKYCRLLPGDLIFSGTPAGVGPLQVGDKVAISCGDLLEECRFDIGEPET